ncbi:MAG: 3-keto-disaccharide hydrolase [Planctomycetota bacterium]
MEIGSYQEMGTLMLLRLSISTFLSVLLPFVAIAEEPNALTPSQSAAGWVSLFDGESPRGWRGYRKDAFPKQGWFVEDGWLRVIKAGGGGDIVTVDQFDDFILEMEWKAGKGANSGIMYLTNENNGAPYESAPEYQVLDIDDLTSSDSTSAGGLYGLYSPMNKKQNPTGEINHTRIVHCGGYIEHWLNGVRVLKAKIGSLDWNRRVANSKFAAWKDFGTVKKGHICLQDHNDSDLWYRSIKIREIPATERWRFTGESELLFNGRNLDGWDAFLNGSETKDQVWSVKDGILTCKGTPAGYIYTQKDYQDFVLELDWRWDPVTKKEGNSGVLFRKIGEHKVWPRSIEAQLMSKNAGDFWNIEKFVMTTDPDRTNDRNTKKTEMAEYPVGEWNRYEIHCIGGDVTLIVNGKVVNKATGCEQVAGPICLQSEGTPIQFRDIRIHAP